MERATVANSPGATASEAPAPATIAWWFREHRLIPAGFAGV